MARKKTPEGYNPEDEPGYRSKTELKQDAKDIKALGLTIIKMSVNQRKKLDLDEELSYAFEIADKISNTREGYRRQLQFIGRLLRSRDVDEITLAMNKLTNTNKQAEKELMALEKTREQLLTLGDDKVNELVAQYPEFERQKLRQLVKKTQKQQLLHPEQTSPSFRELYQYLKEVIK
ncbi:MAG: ribosome-associated protein [Alteromonadaceae bacterium]|jgi:ribosome-associated protein